MKTSKTGRLTKLLGMGVNIVGKSITGALTAKGELEIRVAQARAMVQTLSELKGASMKIGQMLSIQGENLFPKEVTDILASLQNSAPAFSSDEIRRIIQTELEDKFESNIEKFESQSLAAASIGQVHRVLLTNGDRAVVKVQYPGIANAIDSEVELLKRVLTPVSKFLGGQINLEDIVAEVKTLLKQEVDYLREADYLEKFGRFLKGDTRYVVPSVYRELSTGKALTMSYEEGLHLNELLALNLAQEERNKFGLWIYELVLREVFEFHTIQTDPNFANFLFRVENGKAKSVVLLDFGASRVYPRDFIAKYRKFGWAVFENERERALTLANELGFLVKEESQEAKDIFFQMTRLTVEPALLNTPFDFGRSDLPKRIVNMIWPFKRAIKKTPVPTAVIFLNRKLGGVYNLLRGLGAEINVHPIFVKYFT